LCIPPSLALHRLGLSVMLTSSRKSTSSFTTARYIVPDAYYRPITQAAAPVSYYSWKSRFFVTVTRIKQSNHDLVRSHNKVLPSLQHTFVSGWLSLNFLAFPFLLLISTYFLSLFLSLTS